MKNEDGNGKADGATSQVIVHNVDMPVNALSTSRDSNRVVVAGRNLLKIYSVEENGFQEKYNLKVGRQAALNFSSLDVAWSPIEDHILASAATNGAVVIWNLDKVAKNKADTTYQVHKRTVNKIAFHPSDASCLLSGSQDATIKLFDLRKRGAAQSFENGDSIRDIQFSPHFNSTFLAADEAGNVKCWDLRNTERPTRQFTAHTGPLLSLDFHPTARSWVATGGRDKLIKIWDISSERAHIVYSVQTIAPVNKVKWRPSREWHIATCSLVIDFSIHVWDIRRPYIPFASFDNHKNVATGVAWRNDPDTFLSCGKDQLLIQQSFAHASRPADYANPAGVDIGPYGDVACAFSNNILQSINRNGSESTPKFTAFPGLNKIRSVALGNSRNNQQQIERSGDQFRAPHTSSLYVNMLAANDKHLSMDWFIQSALEYRLTGKSLTEICFHNAKVAFSHNRAQIATTWLMLLSLYDQGFVRSSVDLSSELLAAGNVPVAGDLNNGSLSDQMIHVDMPPETVVYTTETDVEEDVGDNLEFRKAKSSTSSQPRVVSNMHADLFFGDGELGKIVFDEFEALRIAQTSDNDWKLQHEAFEPRPVILRTNSDLTSDVGDGDLQQSSNAGSPNGLDSDTGVNSSSNLRRRAGQPSRSILQVTSQGRRFASWSFQPLVSQMLHHYADTGDVQMAASVLLVLGEKGENLVDNFSQRMWFSAYIELLDTFQLSSVSAQVIRLCPLPEINLLNQDSTTVTLTCGLCNKALSSGWWCDRCRRATSVCSVCNQVAKGLYVWCHGCNHGGHLHHLRTWFQKYTFCPAGCGHLCELSQD